jgi:hypothetical protein
VGGNASRRRAKKVRRGINLGWAGGVEKNKTQNKQEIEFAITHAFN